MSFISYCMKYYYNELQKFESSVVTDETIYKAKQLIKIVDDLIDEGYSELSEKLEESYNGVSSLKKYLSDNNAEPFGHNIKPFKETDITYGQEDIELTEAIKVVSKKAFDSVPLSDDTFLQKLIRFCNWIGYKKDTAYIFLLRDTMLPYIYYKSKDRNNVYPWLLGRKTLELLTGNKYIDDELRTSVYKALEFGSCETFDEFCNIVFPEIRKTLCKYPEMKICMNQLLKGIRENNVIVVESGCSGTFPMLLMSLDNRVDMCMYTTYPYLADIYADKIFTTKYEENRLFETLYSQDLYFRFSNLNNGFFYVNKCKNQVIEEKALREIKTMLN